jgi:hypothetical protein
VFAGAGLSMPAGYVNWKVLLKPLAEDVDLDIGREYDLLRVTQYAINHAGGRARVNAHLIEQFARRLKPTVNHQILAKLPIDVYWTLNYDSLIEDALIDAGRTPAVKHAKEQLTSQANVSDVFVYKMHGDQTRMDSCVIAASDYEEYDDVRGEFTELLRGALTERTFLFLGCSFTDPNIDHVLSRLRVRHGSNRREHFWITKRVVPGDYPTEQDFEYERTRERHRMRDLQRYGIQTVLVDAYGEITNILKEIRDRFRRRTVFVSGASHVFEPLGQGPLESLVRGIGAKLVEEGYTLISGGGLGVGTAVVLGAVTRSEDLKLNVSDRVKVAAFDHRIDDKAIRDAVYRRYREHILEEAGFAIFLSGNKLDGEDVVESDNVKREFEVACSRGSVPVPVGATGHAAEWIWAKVVSNLLDYYKDERARPYVDAIGPGSTDVSSIIDAVMNLIHLYDGRRR